LIALRATWFAAAVVAGLPSTTLWLVGPSYERFTIPGFVIGILPAAAGLMNVGIALSPPRKIGFAIAGQGLNLAAVGASSLVVAFHFESFAAWFLYAFIGCGLSVAALVLSQRPRNGGASPDEPTPL
jgi:hypothetical protein